MWVACFSLPRWYLRSMALQSGELMQICGALGTFKPGKYCWVLHPWGRWFGFLWKTPSYCWDMGTWESRHEKFSDPAAVPILCLVSLALRSDLVLRGLGIQQLVSLGRTCNLLQSQCIDFLQKSRRTLIVCKQCARTSDKTKNVWCWGTSSHTWTLHSQTILRQYILHNSTILPLSWASSFILWLPQN